MPCKPCESARKFMPRRVAERLREMERLRDERRGAKVRGDPGAQGERPGGQRRAR